MRNLNLTKQEFTIFRDGEDDTEVKSVTVLFENDPFTHELSVTIADDKKEIVFWEKEAKALKKVFENTKYIFNQ